MEETYIVIVEAGKTEAIFFHKLLLENLNSFGLSEHAEVKLLKFAPAEDVEA